MIQTPVIVGAALLPILVSAFLIAIDPNGPDGAKNQLREKEPLSADLAVLDRFIGPWNLIENHYNSRGEVVATAKGTEEIAWVLDNRAVRRAYASGAEPSVFRAHGWLTWNAEQHRYDGVWFDNKSTSGPTTLIGAWDDPSRTMTFSLAPIGADPSKFKFKVVERFTDDEHRVATTYKLDGSQVEKVLEVQYVRSAPCPASSAGVRVFDPDAGPPKED